MKIFFAHKQDSELADERSLSLQRTKEALLKHDDVEEVCNPEQAEAILIQEQNSFKNFRYVNDLLNDPLISKYADRIYTINDDDCATGLLRGIYTSLPAYRFDKELHVAVPYMQFPNEQVFMAQEDLEPTLLASWRGNTKSNGLRLKLIDALKGQPGILIQKTESWLNHKEDEKVGYVNLIRNARFSICPAGWAPVSFRIYESMALGRCPVILADSFVPPEGPDWNSFALFFPEKKIRELHAFLTNNEDTYARLGMIAQKSWETYFSTAQIGDYYASALLSLMRSRQNTTNEEAFKRWKSIRLHWTNEWTIPQRILNKAKRLAQKQPA
jgi:hypothetical protein